MPERGHHRCCQPAPTMIRMGPDRREPQPIRAAVAARNGHQLGMINLLITGNGGKGPGRAAVQDHPDDRSDRPSSAGCAERPLPSPAPVSR